MLHEILLSLSGHPSPLLRTDRTGINAPSVISPPERELLASIAHLSDLHVKLINSTAQITSSHPSAICRAVTTAVDSIYLAAFQRKILEVEDSILRKDAGLVGAYNTVPLTAIVGEFSGWTRRMDWLWNLIQFIMEKNERGTGENDQDFYCTGAQIIDRLRGELQTGYVDIEETVRDLVRAAEIAWLKQVSAWILYGRLPTFGGDDFFIQELEDSDEDFVLVPQLLPTFIPSSAATSMLFIGKSLNQIRAKSSLDSKLRGIDHLSSQLKELSRLTYPLDPATFSRTITGIRLHLSKTILQKLLPVSKVVEMLQLLRDFFLLGRGEFAMALSQQADETLRSRWQRADNLAFEKRDALGTVVVKEGEVAAVLSRTWAVLGSMQGQHAEEDEGLELARDLLQLSLTRSKSKSATPMKSNVKGLAPTPFQNLLFSVPAVLSLNIPSPLDLFLTNTDLQTYTVINSYLLSIRRAHLHLTDLWKITSLRRHYPPPPGPPYGSTKNGQAKVQLLRERHISRSNAMRLAWVTCSAAIFFLAETEGYLQTEVVAGLWEGFQKWLLTGKDDPRQNEKPNQPKTPAVMDSTPEDDDVWLTAASAEPHEQSPARHHMDSTNSQREPHDPETLAAAHRIYLRTLTRRLLLTNQSFTDPLYEVLVEIDHLVALIRRLHGIWTSMDLEADMGVIDAFVDLEREEADVQRSIKKAAEKVKLGIEDVVSVLRAMEGSPFTNDDFSFDEDGGAAVDEDDDIGAGLQESGRYVPRRVGGIDRLLVKLDFGTWFKKSETANEFDDDDDMT